MRNRVNESVRSVVTIKTNANEHGNRGVLR